jgi:uncharacterized protein YjgD (DUF1641 family)
MSETITQQAPTQTVQSETAAASQTIDRGQLDVLTPFLKPEVQESLKVLAEHLPKLTEMAILLTKTYDFAQSVATDRVLIEDFKGGIQEFVKPVQEKVKDIASAAIEANDRAQASNETIGLFGLLKMLKDPQIQKVFRFAQAFLDVTSERQKQR